MSEQSTGLMREGRDNGRGGRRGGRGGEEMVM